jgi:DNA-binding transcriptional LysR family regulator
MAVGCQGAGITTYGQDALAAGAVVRALPEYGDTDGIMHLVFASRRGMLPSVQTVIDFAVAALRSSVVSQTGRSVGRSPDGTTCP